MYPARATVTTVVTMPTPTLSNGVPQLWAPTAVDRYVGGFWVIAMGPHGGTLTDVTYFRNIPAIIDNYSFLDPFSYGVAVLKFPQITIHDDLETVGGGFLGTEANPADVDLYWVPAAVGTDFVDPMTGQISLTYGAPQKIWEGFIASLGMDEDDNGSSLEVQCQGALFQADGYKQKPFYPRRPYQLEALIFEELHPDYGPAPTQHYFGKSALRTNPVLVNWPAGWTKVIPPRAPDEPNLYTPVSVPTRLTTGYVTRNTGSWDSTLTGFIQDMLSIMWTTDDSGVTPGNQWTLRCYPGRQPVLEVRDQARTPDFTLWAGTPGVKLSGMSKDYTQIENSVYGSGTGIDGTAWSNSHITGAWNRTDYDPLAHLDTVFPEAADGNTSADPNVMVHESRIQYPSGVSQEQGLISAQKRLATFSTAGWTGTLVLKVDPAADFPRWLITAGMVVKIKGFDGSGTTGINFHIAEAVHNPQAGTVECKVDTKFRDLLTLEEAKARNIDPMTPSKLLQVNKRSVMVEDILAPWDDDKGSGYIPMSSRHGANKRQSIARYNFYQGMPLTTQFPYESWTQDHPPNSYTTSADGFTKGPYVRVDANAALTKDRWSFVPVLTSQKGTIRRTELAAYDAAGNVLPCDFHISFYVNVVDHTFMPHVGSNYSPFQPGAFESITVTGAPNGDLVPDDKMIIGWGNALQKAGYSPGLFSQGQPQTGKFVDEGTWQFDNSTNKIFDRDASEGEQQRPEAITIYAAIYAEAGQNAFFLGRLYKEEQTGAA